MVHCVWTEFAHLFDLIVPLDMESIKYVHIYYGACLSRSDPVWLTEREIPFTN